MPEKKRPRPQRSLRLLLSLFPADFRHDYLVTGATAPPFRR